MLCIYIPHQRSCHHGKCQLPGIVKLYVDFTTNNFPGTSIVTSATPFVRLFQVTRPLEAGFSTPGSSNVSFMLHAFPVRIPFKEKNSPNKIWEHVASTKMILTLL